MTNPPAATWGLLLIAACSVETSGLGAAGDAGAADGNRDARTYPVTPRDTGLDSSPLPDAEAPDDAEAAITCPADDTLVVCLSFEDTLVDGSPYGNDATGDVNFAQGHRGRAIALAAASTATVMHTDALDATSLTVELWARPRELPASGRAGLVDKNGQYGVFIYPPADVHCIGTGVTARARSAMRIDEWSHVACVFGEGAVAAYIDGALQESVATAGAIASGTSAIHIGENAPDGSDQFRGRIDELRVYRTARTPSQVAESATE